MSAEALFSLAGMAVLPGWLLLVFAPRWRFTHGLAAVALPVCLALVYAFALVPRFLAAPGGFGSLAEVALLFQDPYLLLAGWVHYLAFDLFVGSWEVRDARRLTIPHVLVVPCLVATFLFGPLGWLAYMALRAGMRRAVLVDDPR